MKSNELLKASNEEIRKFLGKKGFKLELKHVVNFNMNEADSIKIKEKMKKKGLPIITYHCVFQDNVFVITIKDLAILRNISEEVAKISIEKVLEEIDEYDSVAYVLELLDYKLKAEGSAT